MSGKPASDYEEAESLLSKLGLGTDLQQRPDEDLDKALANALQAANPAGDNASPDAGKPDPLEPTNAENTSKDGQSQAGDTGQQNSNDRRAAIKVEKSPAKTTNPSSRN